MTAAALVAFAAASSEILALVYAPLVLLRVVALPRWREHAVTAGWRAGLLVQVPVVLESYAQHTQRVTSLARLAVLGHADHGVDGRRRGRGRRLPAPPGHRRGGDRIPLVRQSPWALTAVAALACVLALGWLSDYRYVTQRTSWGYWKPVAERMLTGCKDSTTGEITTWTWRHSTITTPCSRLRR